MSVDVRAMKREVRRGLTVLEKAMRMISTDKNASGGAPCFKGIRIPVHDIADMLVDGDTTEAIRTAYPMLTDAQINAAALYARAYPRRGRPRRAPAWRHRHPLTSTDVALDELPQAS